MRQHVSLNYDFYPSEAIHAAPFHQYDHQYPNYFMVPAVPVPPLNPTAMMQFPSGPLPMTTHPLVPPPHGTTIPLYEPPPPPTSVPPFAPPPGVATPPCGSSPPGDTAEGDLKEDLSSTPACRHNAWDNVRVRKGVLTLSCRVCRVKWKINSSISKCPAFFNGHCYLGVDCPLLHVHRYKNKDKSPNQGDLTLVSVREGPSAMAPKSTAVPGEEGTPPALGPEKDPIVAAVLQSIFTAMGGAAAGVGPPEMLPVLEDVVTRLSQRIFNERQRERTEEPCLQIRLGHSTGACGGRLPSPLENDTLLKGFHRSPGIGGMHYIPHIRSKANWLGYATPHATSTTPAAATMVDSQEAIGPSKASPPSGGPRGTLFGELFPPRLKR